MGKITKSDLLKRLNSILDKVNVVGYEKISSLEKDFLNSFESENSEEIEKKIRKENHKKVFNDPPFKFKVDNVKYNKHELIIHGTIYLPKFKNKSGIIYGEIVIFPDTNYTINLVDDEGYHAFDYAKNMEYSLESFFNTIADYYFFKYYE